MRKYIPKGIPPATWHKLESIIGSHFKNKREYINKEESILRSSPSPPSLTSHRRTSNTSDSTADKVAQLNSIFMIRLKSYILAVEKIYNQSSIKQQEFIKQYFWEGRRYLDCEIYNKKGEYVSERTLSRMKRDVILALGRELGEIE